MTSTDRFQKFVSQHARNGQLVVQPRMGFSDLNRMRSGLRAVRDCTATAAGTITVDSYTRVNDHASARRAIDADIALNGFPLVFHGAQRTAAMLEGVAGPEFPVQVRHGSARPFQLISELLAAGVDATEGGPVSYCLPYSRVPLRQATDEWARSSALAASSGRGLHMETFGGCLLGQLCPPGFLVALSVLEALFFAEHGLRSISLSYAQQTHLGQDIAAVRALRRLASERLPGITWHIVIYTFMGVYPRTEIGAFRLLEQSVRVAVFGGAERLIVKTAAEAHRIPTIGENVSALEFAAAMAASLESNETSLDDPEPIYAEAARLVDDTLKHANSVGDALVAAFAAGHLDIPYCLHHDNANRARAGIDATGRLCWTDAGRMAVKCDATAVASVNSGRLLEMLNHNRDQFDRSALTGLSTGVLL